MNDYKATDIMFLKRRFQRLGPDNEAAFLAMLSPDEVELYKHTLPVSWVPTQAALALDAKALPFLYPEDQATFRQFGHDMAYEDFRGIYKVLLKVSTIDFIASATGNLWSTFNKVGEARGQRVLGEKMAWLQVEHYPNMPDAYREYIAGYLQGLFEIVGASNVQVSYDKTAQTFMKWMVSWSDKP